MRIAIALLGLAGCHEVFELDERPTVAIDASVPDAKVCDRETPFGRGSEVAIEGTYSVEAARFDPTQAIAYLSLCMQGDVTKTTCDLFQSTYVPATKELGFYVKLGINHNTAYDSYASITPDGQHLVFGSSRSGSVRTYISTKNNGQFTTPTELRVIANVAFANEPYLLGDGQTLYLSGERIGGSTESDLYRARGGPPTFGGTSELVPGVNGSGGELAPVVSDDELEIYFSSDRESTGVPSSMPLDIFGATRATADAAFGTPKKIAALSTTNGTDWPVWISPDRCDLYYINKVNNFATLYVAHR